jgi:predicted restriction endonuclease
LQLADFVRVENDYRCAVSQTSCSSFLARDGHPYVEVHHIIPMAQQAGSAINLDRVTNMAPLCPGCHTCLHRGAAADAGKLLGDVLAWFEIKHGQPFADANNDLRLRTTPDAVLTMYGLG